MPKFFYRIEDTQGRGAEGVLEADSEAVARKFLDERHYKILELSPKREFKAWKDFQERMEKVPPADFNFFVRQLATLLKAGVPMLTALMTLRDSAKDPVLKKTLTDMFNDVEKGNSFSETIQKHPRVFNRLFTATIRSGEAIGELDNVLLRLAELLERDYQTASKIKSALRYPILAFSVMTIAFLAAMLFIIPRFETLFSGFGAELPLPTKILLGTSSLVKHYWYFVLGAAALAFFLIRRHYKTEAGRLFWDGAMLKVWIFGDFFKQAVLSRFTRMLGMMLKSGVNILQALELVAEVVDNATLRRSILKVREKVSQGHAMAEQMGADPIFPTIIVQIVRVGEESGKMDELLIQISSFYDSELDVMTKNMESMIEPFFIVMLAALVLVLALGIFLPMWNIYGVIQKSATG